MKHLFFCLMVSSFVARAIAQTTAANVQPTSINARWDLNKYLWSQTNYKTSKADKPALDFDAIDNWIGVGPDYVLAISNDGKFFTYGITKGTGTPQLQSITVKSTSNIWQHEIGKSNGFFSANSKQYIFQDKDELCFLELGTNNTRRVKDVLYFGQPSKGKGEWLAYQLKTGDKVVLQNLVTGKEKVFSDASGLQFDNSNTWFTSKMSNGELLVYNLATEKELRFPPAVSYLFNSNAKSLVLQTSEKSGDRTVIALQHVSLPQAEKKTIWMSADTAISIFGYMPDDEGKQVVFTTVEKKSGKDELSIWYWKAGMHQAEIKVNNQNPAIGNSLMIGQSESLPSGATFSGKHILFLLQPRPEILPTATEAPINVEVWNYKDTILQSAQPFVAQQASQDPTIYIAAFNLDKGQVIRVEKEGDQKPQFFPVGDFTIVVKSKKDIYGDRFWEAGYNTDSVWLLSLKDGSRKLLPIRKWNRGCTWLSPGERYLLYFDAEKQCNYFSYDLYTGKIVNISASVPAWQLGNQDNFIRTKDKPATGSGIAAWLQGDEGVLVYDDFDIWKLDLSGKKSAINITGGFGRKHHTMFSLMNTDRFSGTPPVINEKDTLLLRAFNDKTKYNGFYRKMAADSGNPELLYMGPCFMQRLTGVDGLAEGMQPIKAAGANVWIVKKQTATEAPNYFVTTDFIKYSALTDVQPHKAYNWVSTELISFKQLDGTISQGVLYKPENFDPSKKYPAIISFYTDLSDRPYQYPTPGYMIHPLLINNPAWMASHGYLVFLPDIYFTKGQWGPSTVNTVDGAARYLKTLSYVDGERLGATGHSNSGRFGFYLLSHSTSFAAMCIGEGMTNMISGGVGIGLSYDGASMLEWAEQSATGTGLGMLWKNKTTWLDHSAVLNADKITSPLLLFDNKDGLQQDQAAQLFTSLRRLDKKAWWLHYDFGGHALRNPPYLRDFTLRFTQFFDHYLMGAPAPRWMTQGIPYKYKGVETRYELDPAGVCGDNCPACKKIKQKP